ncbi:NtaA/DmoA family FMN-dependent monooxygenase [Nocardioides bruguierae]|uniref:NtaA/DmoA family FMN-dependent monooxygenase n=1 Tax=Nocardioides bruguierae TaxID=2945102 RepID=A0A9X2D859_9ACTN|nr:NtaA/DmoA family FMN-dependent monooxygenase [Nocardioides bruguierae]MCM0621135.1 NtaA/DmoA family FMN-dependent monooxygenase [Nocardioides bruguierae]
MSRPFHLAWFTSFKPPAWRSPWGGVSGEEWMTGEYYVSMVKQLERAGFDFIMFEDSSLVSEALGGTAEMDLKHGLHSPKLDPFPLLPVLARETEKIGLIATGSTSFYPPFILARVMATMDHLTGGRVGWNVVTSSQDIAAQNYGIDKLLEHDERYVQAQEFLDVVKALWDSWEPGAVVMDRETGHYADHTKVSPIHHEGTYFKVRGPLNMPAGPQGHPVICQAGGSPAGRDFAAQHANAIVATNPLLPRMKEYADDIRARAERLGRDPDEIRVLFHLSPVVGETEEEAWSVWRRTYGMEDPLQVEQTLAILAAVTSIDWKQFDLDEPFPQGLTTNGHQSVLDDLMARNVGKTLRESLTERAQMGPQTVGTVAQVADRMEQIVEDTGIDGFLIRAETGLSHTRRYIDSICFGLAPELQRRGLVRTDFPHATFRDNLLAF